MRSCYPAQWQRAPHSLPGQLCLCHLFPCILHGAYRPDIHGCIRMHWTAAIDHKQTFHSTRFAQQKRNQHLLADEPCRPNIAQKQQQCCTILPLAIAHSNVYFICRGGACADLTASGLALDRKPSANCMLLSLTTRGRPDGLGSASCCKLLA